MRNSLFLLGGLLFLVCYFPLFAAEQAVDLILDPGGIERTRSLVHFKINPGAYRQIYVWNRGNRFPAQVDENGDCWGIVQLPQGKAQQYFIKPADYIKLSNLSCTRKATKLELKSENLSLMSYQAEPGPLPRANIKELFIRGGYLHPINTLSGKTVTDDFPANHLHHHGVWWSWTKTEFQGRHPDFWNMGDGKGKVEFVAVDKTWSGPVQCGFISRHRFVDLTGPEPIVALNETWEVHAYLPDIMAKFWMFDLVSTQTCATSSALKLPEYRYGGLGFRGNWAWNGKDKTDFLTSEGEHDREKGQGTRGRWCDITGLVDGQKVGIAILCHPDNFRAPQPMRLHPTEPFFNFAPQEAGDMEIAPGKPYVAKYRFIVHDGPMDKDKLDELWNDYAHPIIATWTGKAAAKE
ncbi:MAG TPA: PmoA family protein [Verrucomicrobiae bacterium]